jgi:hypothetical protein
VVKERVVVTHRRVLSPVSLFSIGCGEGAENVFAMERTNKRYLQGK